MIYYSVYKSPMGSIFIASTDKGLCKMTLQEENAIDFFSYIEGLDRCSLDGERNLQYINMLDDYFKGNLKQFHMDMDIKGTDFQKSVWKELTKIPYGEVRTYGYISKSLGMSCPRAVGQANKKNPLPIVVPCHRVVSSDGIGGYSGTTSGESINIKRRLLELEGFDCSVF